MHKKLERTIFELSHSTCKTAFFISFPDNLSWQQVHVLWVGNLHFALHLIFPLTFLHPPWSLASSLQLSYSTQKKVEFLWEEFLFLSNVFCKHAVFGRRDQGRSEISKTEKSDNTLHAEYLIFYTLPFLYFKATSKLCRLSAMCFP